EVVTERAQARRVCERGQRDLSDLDRLLLTLERRAHCAIASDDDVRRVRRDRERWLEWESVRGHDLSACVELEGSGARIRGGSVAARDGQESGTLYRDVERIPRLLNRALRERAHRRNDARARSEFDRRRRRAARTETDAALGLVEEIFEGGVLSLEA